MTEDRVTAMLHRVADPMHVGPVPISSMVARTARKRRRRRLAVVLSSGVAVAATIVLAVGLGTGRGDHAQRFTPQPPTSTTGPTNPTAMAAEVAGLDCTRLLAVNSTSPSGSAGGFDIGGFDAECRAVPLLDGPTTDYDPTLAPDGTHLAFVRREPHGTALMLLDRPTDTVTRVDTSVDSLGDPTFSPDGTRIAYWYNRGDGHPHLRVIDIITGKITNLTDGPINDIWPTWNQDGTRLAFNRGTNLATITVSTRHVHILVGSRGLTQPFWTTGTTRRLLALEPITHGVTPPDAFRIVYLGPRGTQRSPVSKPIPGSVNSVTYDVGGIHVSSTPEFGSSTITKLNYSLQQKTRLTLPGQVYMAPPR
jgi:hypothetical protein